MVLVFRDVVPEEGFVLFRDAVESLFELHLDQPALAPELPHVSLYLLGDPDRVLEGADRGHDLPQRYGPVVLVHGQASRLLPQPPGELLERRDGRVRFREDYPYVLDDVRPVGALVKAHHPPALGDCYDEAARLLGRAVRRKVAHPRLLGVETGVRTELDVRVMDGGDIRRDHDRAVHLRKLVEAHRRELELDPHPPRDDAEVFELLGPVDDDKGPIVRPYDVLNGLPEIRAGSHEIQGPGQLRGQLPPLRTHRSATATASSSVFTSTTLASLRARPSGSSPGGPSDVPSGLIIRLKPILTISEVRLGAPETYRRSPVSPTSPKQAVPLPTGLSRIAEAMASATPRSAAGSSTRTPPVTFTYTS